jgi:RNA 3'-terminal phosphate cyclase (ATP)
LRNATTLSVILNIPVHVKNIRAGRSQDGLRPQHLTSIQLLTEFSQGKLDNANIGSTEIQFIPKKIQGGNYLGDTKTAG